MQRRKILCPLPLGPLTKKKKKRCHLPLLTEEEMAQVVVAARMTALAADLTHIPPSSGELTVSSDATDKPLLLAASLSPSTQSTVSTSLSPSQKLRKRKHLSAHAPVDVSNPLFLSNQFNISSGIHPQSFSMRPHHSLRSRPARLSDS